VYSFSFGSNATGTFTTGAASPADPGFSLVTALQVNTFVDATSGPVPVSIDATSSGQFAPEAAYDPTTGAFVNHFGGDTFTNLGDIGNTGQGESLAGTINGQPAFVLGPSFSSGSTALIIQNFGASGNVFTANGTLVVTPQAIPEPSSLVLFGLGIVG
jgi:PEP-CTERM motif